ncbi:MAG: AlkA protein [Cellulomonas sp.]|nr:AlkA N-terminal domain-containing protein [Cellulomonas sp.]MCR6648092.1 AlkA protein [Cellulomonas sp.]
MTSVPADVPADAPAAVPATVPALAPPADDGAVVVRVPFDARAALAYLATHVVPGVETLTTDATAPTGTASSATASSGTVERLVPDDDGGLLRLVVHLADDEVSARLVPVPGIGTRPPGAGATSSARVVELLDQWFGLGDDLAAVVEHLRDDDVLGPFVAARPHLRVPGHVDAFEVAAQTVLGQQVSLAAARTFTGRLADALGPVRADGLTLFPSAAHVAAADPDALREVLRVPASRARTLVGLARACADGLDLRATDDPDATRAALVALPGIGPWTADYLALRATGLRDAFPAGDLVLRQALGLDKPRDVEARAQGWSPWRAYAAQHLWSGTVLERLTRAAASPARRRSTARREPPPG